MTTTTLSHSLTFMFKDEDWFWKVSVGALALLLIGAGIGYFFVIGYQVETVRRCRNHEPSLPEWNSPGMLWRSGLRVGSAMLGYCALIAACMTAIHHTGIFNIGIGIVAAHTVVLPFVILRFLQDGSLRSCFDFQSMGSMIGRNRRGAAQAACAGFCIFMTVFCFGWMALIVGWPFFIFWGMLAAAALTASLAPASESIEAASR